MNQLAPCPACNRHVRTQEIDCPFCAAPLPEVFRAQPAPPRFSKRVSRAAMVAASATTLLVGCGSDSAPSDSGVVMDGGDGGAVAAYGAPAPDGGGPAPLYGAAPEYGAPPPLESK